MRGAGCVYNDIVDRDLDAKVERTRNRPVASGAVSLKAAWGWLLLLSAIGLVVLPALPMLLVYAGSIFWVIGYDTIYALQDREDDALIGIRSSARALGTQVKPGLAIFYALALGLWAAAIWQVRPQAAALLALLPAAAHLGWQVMTLKVDDGADALAKFRANRFAGLLVALAMATIGASA